MKKAIMGLLLMFSVGTVSAAPAAAPLVFAVFGYGIVVMNDDPAPRACDTKSVIKTVNGSSNLKVSVSACEVE